jgi:hypothetical protein
MERNISRRDFELQLVKAATGTALVSLQPACGSQLQLPPERPHLGPLKPFASARTTRTVLPTGQLQLTIEHERILGVTPQMLRWWFENVSATMVYRGTTYLRYQLWHPRDHIRLEVATRSPAGRTGQGAHWRIVEAFAANPRFYVDSTVYVEKLDDEGLSLVRREGRGEFFRLDHRFATVSDGASYRSRMTVGPESGMARLVFNNVVRPWVFPDDMASAWLAHNVEEVGLLEHILPALYAGRGGSGG